MMSRDGSGSCPALLGTTGRLAAVAFVLRGCGPRTAAVREGRRGLSTGRTRRPSLLHRRSALALAERPAPARLRKSSYTGPAARRHRTRRPVRLAGDGRRRVTENGASANGARGFTIGLSNRKVGAAWQFPKRANARPFSRAAERNQSVGGPESCRYDNGK